MSTVLTTCLAASGLAFGAFLAITAARSLGVFLFTASLGILFFAASFFLLAAFFLVLIALMVLGAGGCRSAHHGHDHHGTEQNLFHIFLLLM